MHVTLCFSWQAKMTCAYLNRITKWPLIISSTKRQRDRLQGSTPGFTLFLFTRWPVDIAPPQRCSYFTSFRLWLGGNLATHFGRSSSIRSPFRLPGSLFSCLFVSSHWHYLQVHGLPSTEYQANDLLTAVNVHSSSFTPRSAELGRRGEAWELNFRFKNGGRRRLQNSWFLNKFLHNQQNLKLKTPIANQFFEQKYLLVKVNSLNFPNAGLTWF